MLLAVGVSAALSPFSEAQGVSVLSRRVVSYGPDGKWIREPYVASDGSTPGQVKLVASWITIDETTLRDRIAYAISHDSGTTWSDKDGLGNWRILPMPTGYDQPTYFQFDPTVGFDSVTGSFVISGANEDGEGIGPQPWRVLSGRMPSGQDVIPSTQSLSHADIEPHVSSDFPHLVVDSRPGYGSVRYYIVAWTAPNVGENANLVMHRGTRNLDGSILWADRENILLGPGQTIRGRLPTAAVGNDGTLYVAYANYMASPGYKVLRKDDLSSYFVETSLNVQKNELDGTKVGGLFKVLDNSSVAVDPNNPNLVYVAYADSSSSGSGDKDVEVYLTWSTDRGVNWTTPIVISDDPADVQKDQFFPAITVDAQSRVHIAFYDTRDFPAPAGQSNVKVGLYYCRAIPDGMGGLNIEANVKLESQAINTPSLVNPTWIGDYLGIAAIPWTNGRDALVVTYMGTDHTRPPGEGPIILVTDETIFSRQIVQNN